MKKVKNALKNTVNAIKEKPGWFVAFLCMAALVLTLCWLTLTGQLPSGDFKLFVFTFTALYFGIAIGQTRD